MIFIYSLFFLFSFSDEPTTQNQDVPKSENSTIIEKVKNEGNKALEKTKESIKDIKKSTTPTKDIREDKKWMALASYSLIDLWLPSKLGLNLVYQQSKKSSWEFEWLHSSIPLNAIIDDIGKMSEDRYSLLYRSYGDKNSFHWLYGFYYYQFNVVLDNKYLNNIVGLPDEVDVINVNTLGLSWGFGNRWIYKNNMVLSVDWLVLNIPFKTTKKEAPFFDQSNDDSAKDTVDDVLSIIESFPGIAALKIQFGLSF